MIVINTHTRETCALIQQYNNLPIEFIDVYVSARDVLRALNLSDDALEQVTSHNKLMKNSTMVLEPAGVYQLVLINDEIDFWDWYSDEALAVAKESMLRMSNYIKARRILKDIMDAPDAVDKLPRIVNQLIAAREYKDSITKDDACLSVWQQIADKLKERGHSPLTVTFSDTHVDIKSGVIYVDTKSEIMYEDALTVCYEIAGEYIA
jgi:hypothetical protein